MMTAPDLSGFSDAQKDALIVSSFEQIAHLEQRIVELEARLGLNSATSSKPPSSDGYGKPAPKSQRGKSGKRSGGQKGHRGSTLGRVAEPDHVVEHRPEACTGGGSALAPDAPVLACLARQMFDVPTPRPLVVTEHRALTVACPCCRARCRGEFPEGGDERHAVRAERAGDRAVPEPAPAPPLRAPLAECLKELLKVSISEGTLDNALRRAEGKLEGVEAAKKEVEAAKAEGATRLESARIDAIERRYRRCLSTGRAELPELAAAPPGKGGRKKKHKVANLHERLEIYQPEVLAFVYDFAHPFDNNQAERDVRMVKVKQKVSGGFRSERGAAAFCRLRGYISTANKQGRSVYGSLRELVEGRPFDPSAATLAPTG